MANKLLKPFGESDIKLKAKWIKKMRHQDTKSRKNNQIILTSKEKSELLVEALLTIFLLLLLNIAILVILKHVVMTNSTMENLIFGIKNVFWNNFNFTIVYSWRNIFIIILLLFDVIITYWRIKRRYKQFQLQHIISELHYIANGHYDHLIHFEIGGDLGKVINSINGLVISIREAIQEERRIKQSKDELITNVSHDIRTPLTSIIGYLQLINNRQFSTEDEAIHFASIAYAKSKQLKTMVDQLFEYSTMQQQAADILSYSKFDLNQLLEQLSVDFYLQTEEKGIQLTLDVHPIPFEIEADSEKIVRIFSNLISNALKYGQTATEIQINAHQQDGMAIITVKNNGVPIPKESIDKLFHRFYRGDPSRNQKIEGTGLGLSIVESIVTAHGGKIHAESDNHWTSFIMQIPLKRPDR